MGDYLNSKNSSQPERCLGTQMKRETWAPWNQPQVNSLHCQQTLLLLSNLGHEAEMFAMVDKTSPRGPYPLVGEGNYKYINKNVEEVKQKYKT